mmetsp:Transcript_13859/g.29009  ORF Transcript_13859/g.29009 Transcript_13859/m.29009 type:complete len:211 (-) Transcript_13859:181-813(-)
MPSCATHFFARHLRSGCQLSGATAIVAGVTLASHRSTACCHSTVPEQQQHAHFRAEPQLATMLATASTGAFLMAAAAPALCAVHCAAMPIFAVLLPSLQHIGGGGKLFGGVCMHAVGRKLAFYFVIPCGLISNAVGYPKHQSLEVTGSSLMGISLVTAAAAWAAVARYRLYLNLSGCAMMLGSSYYGKRLAEENGCGCGDCCEGTNAHAH